LEKIKLDVDIPETKKIKHVFNEGRARQYQNLKQIEYNNIAFKFANND